MPNPESLRPELSNKEKLRTELQVILKDSDPRLEHDFVWTAAAFRKIFREIGPQLRENKYTSIVGDDVSGRIPALILHRTLAKMHPGNKPNMLFLQGGRTGNNRERWVKVAKHIEAHKDAFGDNPLVVTEFTKNAGTINKFDVAFSESIGHMPEHAVLVKSEHCEELEPNVHVAFSQYEVGFGWSPFETTAKELVGVERNDIEVLAKPADVKMLGPIRKAVDVTAGYLADELREGNDDG